MAPGKASGCGLLGRCVPPSSVPKPVKRRSAGLAGVPARSATTIWGMDALAAQVWHYWLAVPLTVATVATVAKLVAGYVQKVVAPRYPKR